VYICIYSNHVMPLLKVFLHFTYFICGSKGRGRVGLTSSPSSVSGLSRKCGRLHISQLHGLPWPVTGIALLFTYFILFSQYLAYNEACVRALPFVPISLIFRM
jgi:hypothetical protein